MENMQAELFNEEKDIYESVNLPLNEYEIADIIERFGGEEKQISVKIIDMYMLENESQSCSIYEANYFAQTVYEMDDFEKNILVSLIEIEEKTEENLDIKKLINFAMNANELKVQYIPCKTVEELGDFHLDARLDYVKDIKELEKYKDLPVEIIYDLDTKLIGEKIHKSLKGTFTTYGYITGDVKNIYDGKYPKLVKEKGAIKINIETEIETLKFPMDNRELEEVIKNNGTKPKIVDFKSVVLQLNKLDYDEINIFEIQRLAKEIDSVENNGDLGKYKALLDNYNKNLDIETAIKITDYIPEFALNSNIRNVEDYIKNEFKDIEIPLKEELFESVNLNGYGAKLMKERGVEITGYGLIKAEDGSSLEEKMEQDLKQDVKMDLSM